MKVLIINGSPRKGGNTATAIAEITKILKRSRLRLSTIKLGQRIFAAVLLATIAGSMGNVYLMTMWSNWLPYSRMLME